MEAFAPESPEDWAIFTAHYGIVFAFVQSALNTFHYGEAEFLLLSHTRLEVLIHAVAEGYFVMIAVYAPAPIGVALAALRVAVRELREEMA